MTHPMLTRRTLLATATAALAAPRALLAASPFASDRIMVQAQGSGRDVVLVPSLGSGPASWGNLIRDVPGYRWHLVHVRGFAKLPPAANAGGPVVTPVTNEILRYIAESGIGAPAIIGHSMGGTLAMLAALRSPARIGRLMVVDMLPAPAALVGGTAAGMGFFATQLRQYFTGTEAGRRAFARILQDATPTGRDSDPEVVADALDELAAIDLTSHLPQIRQPLTVIPALPADPQTAAALLDQTRRAYASAPTARIVPVQPSGHMVMLDQPAKFAAAVRGFLK